MKIENYQTLIFDCDGVVLNSNNVKTNAFFKAALPYGEEAAQKLVDYHIARGGISRYKKFEWFLQEVIFDTQAANINQLLDKYAMEVFDGLLTCEIAAGLHDLRDKTAHANWLIVSGGAQNELLEVFSNRKIDTLFNGGIFGSPDSKEEILSREIKNGNIYGKTLFIGDSKYDYESSKKFDLDFTFLKRWSEFKDFQSFFEGKEVLIFDDIYSLGKL